MEIPLFPLNTVLFPGAPLRLHVFEDRYKQMMNVCIDEKLPFGVVLIESGDAELGPLPQPHLIGCTAQITQVQRLPEDRMNMMAVGRDRFRVRRLYSDRAYLRAEVDLLTLTDEDPEWTQGGAARVRELFKRYMHTLQVAGQQPPLSDALLPSASLQMLYFAAFWLQTDLDNKQQFLECESTNELVPRIVRQFHREMKLIDILLARVDISNGETPFSIN